MRLRKSSDFKRVRQQGRSMASRLLILAWAPNYEQHSRIGFVVSKRIARHAVDRNYLKRLLGEAIQPLLASLVNDQDIVLNARQQAVGTDLHTLRQQVAMLLRRARLLHPQETGEQHIERLTSEM
ncbi:MAG: ribonuclease P protein component [Ktedonobacteraceae bacterium]|nr:ribonuclease P protein component [Ktedonobacteraceae bacterium]MBO0791848.1 ribonuclease P protein component [Ktedonobacteraceae bacterium]